MPETIGKYIKILQKLRTMRKKLVRLTMNINVLIVTVLLLLVVCEVGSRIIFGHSLEFTSTEDTLWEIKPDQIGFTVPNRNFANINEFGMRETVNNIGTYPQLKIVMIGDSFTFGWGVKDDETMASQLANIIDRQNVDVSNLGVPGYGIFQMIGLYDKKEAMLDADVVVLTFVEDDMLRQPPELMNEKGLEQKQRLREVARAVLRKSTFAAVMKPMVKRSLGGIFGLSEEKELFWPEFWEKDKERMREFKEVLDSQDKTFVIVPYVYKSGQEEFLKKAVDFAEENDIIIVKDIGKRRRDFLSQNEGVALRLDEGHPNELLHRIASEAIYEVLREYKVFD